MHFHYGEQNANPINTEVQNHLSINPPKSIFNIQIHNN